MDPYLTMVLLIVFGCMTLMCAFFRIATTHQNTPFKVSSVVIISQTATSQWCNEHLAKHIIFNLACELHLALNYEVVILGNDVSDEHDKKVHPELINWQLTNLPPITRGTYRLLITHYPDDTDGYLTISIIDRRNLKVEETVPLHLCLLEGAVYSRIQPLAFKLQTQELSLG